MYNKVNAGKDNNTKAKAKVKFTAGWHFSIRFCIDSNIQQGEVHSSSYQML